MIINALPTNLDISEDTNLAVSTPITLTDDTIGFDPTAAFFDTRTWGSGAGDVTWEFNVSGTNPVITFGDDLTTFGTGLTLGGNLVIPDDGFIGSASDPDAIQIDSSGNIVMSQELTVNEKINFGADVNLYRPYANRLKTDDNFEVVGALIVKQGSVASPAIVFSGDGNTGWWRVAGDTLGFITGGTNRLSISNTIFAIYENLLTLGDAGSVDDVVMSFITSGNNGDITYKQTTDEFDFGDADITTTGFLRADGGVGINTDPTALSPIHVLGNRAGQVSIIVENADGGTTSFARTLVLNDNSVELSTIAHSSNSTASRFGQANLANTGELICAGGPLIVGTIDSDALILGTSSEVAITIHGTSQGITLAESLDIPDGGLNVGEDVVIDGRLTVLGSAILGGVTNNTAFSATGDVTFNGTATIFNDIAISLSSARVPAANAPTWSNFVGNLNAYTYGLNDFQEFTSEIAHSYKEGSTIEFHVHGATNGLEGVDKTIKFEIEYELVDNQTSGVFGDVYAGTTTINGEITIPASTTDKTSWVIAVGTDATGNFLQGTTLVGRVRRIASTGTEPVSDPFVMQVGVHIEEDTIGSRTILAK